MRDGRLEGIFRRWNMWNEDQPRLYARVLASDATEMVPAAAGAVPDAWEATRRYLPALLRAAVITLVLSCLAMMLAVATGVLIASGRVYGTRPLQMLLTGWVEVIRGTPLLLQLFVLYFGLAAFVQLPAFLAALDRPRPELRGVRERNLSGGAPGRPAGSARCRAHTGLHGSADTASLSGARRRFASRWRR